MTEGRLVVRMTRSLKLGLTRSKEVAMTEASLVMLMTMMAQVGISRPSRMTEKKKKPRMSRLLAMR